MSVPGRWTDGHPLRLVAFGLGGVLAAAVLFAMGFLPAGPLMQPTLPPRLSPSAATGAVIALGPLISLWGVSVYIRSSDVFVRRCMTAIATLFAVWMLLVALRYAADEIAPAAVVYLWYLYYVPLLLTPAFCMACVLHVAVVSDRVFRGVVGAVFSVSCALIALVMTNNVHHLVFSFDPTDPEWTAVYSYEPFHWLVVGWMMMLGIALAVIVLHASRLRLRNALVLIGVIAVVLSGYSVLYVLRAEAVFSSNFSLMFVLISLAILELFLDLRVFPSSARYRVVFRELPIDVRVLSLDLKNVFATRAAQPLRPGVLDALSKRPLTRGQQLRFTIEGVDDQEFVAQGIQGGLVLLTEDRADINEQTRLLAEERDALSRGNQLLGAKLRLSRRSLRLDNELALAQEVREALGASFEEISELLDRFSDPHSNMTAAERRREFMRLRLLIAYCKRKGSLLLAEKADADFDSEKVSLVVNELAADARASGINCAAFAACSRAVAPRALSALYDCLFNIVVMALGHEGSTLLVSIKPHEGARLGVEVSYECEGATSFESNEVAQLLCASFDACDAAYRFAGGVGRFRLSVQISPVDYDRGAL